MLSRFFSKQKNKAAKNDPSRSDKPNESALGRPNNLSSEKIRSIIITLNKAQPIFEKAGYSMEQLDVVFGLDAKLTAHYHKINTIEASVYQALLAQLDDNQLIRFILISLHKSEKMQSLFDESDLTYYGLTIDISPKPSITSIFKKS